MTFVQSYCKSFVTDFRNVGNKAGGAAATKKTATMNRQ